MGEPATRSRLYRGCLTSGLEAGWSHLIQETQARQTGTPLAIARAQSILEKCQEEVPSETFERYSCLALTVQFLRHSKEHRMRLQV